MTLDESHTGTGLFRQSDMLVLSLNNARFPNRCVVTNEVVDGPAFSYREKISPQKKAQAMSRYAASAASGFAKGAIASGAVVAAAPIAVLAPAAILAAMKTVKLQFGLSESEQHKYHRRKRLALRLVFGGLLASFGFPFVYLAAFGEPQGLTFMSILLFASLVGGTIVWIGGLIYHVVAVRQPIAIKMCDGTYAWFSGVHKEFLSGLPEFRNDEA